MKKLIVVLLTLLLVTALLLQLGCGKRDVGIHIDWVDFIKFNDITYVRSIASLESYREEDLEYYDKTRFKLADNVDDINYRSKNGDAAFVEEETPVYSIKGYSPAFRLLVKGTGIYEADTNPHAKKGADLLDIGGRVEYIGINSPIDGKTELASIREESLVSSLVEMVLNAPVDQTFRSAGGEQLFIAFHLKDGTTVNRSFRPNSGELSRGILLPQEFGEIIKSLVP